MIVKLFDRTEIHITVAEANKLEAALQKSTDGFVTIGGNMLKKSAIAAVMQGGLTAADIPNFDAKTLPSGKVCRAEHSISAEIMWAAQRLHCKVDDDNPEGLKSHELLRDKDWRDMMYAKLKAGKRKWCDARTGDCACEPQKAMATK